MRTPGINDPSGHGCNNPLDERETPLPECAHCGDEFHETELTETIDDEMLCKKCLVKYLNGCLKWGGLVGVKMGE